VLVSSNDTYSALRFALLYPLLMAYFHIPYMLALTGNKSFFALLTWVLKENTDGIVQVLLLRQE
jgi:hypothetical protein